MDKGTSSAGPEVAFEDQVPGNLVELLAISRGCGVWAVRVYLAEKVLVCELPLPRNHLASCLESQIHLQ